MTLTLEYEIGALREELHTTLMNLEAAAKLNEILESELRNKTNALDYLDLAIEECITKLFNDKLTLSELRAIHISCRRLARGEPLSDPPEPEVYQ